MAQQQPEACPAISVQALQRMPAYLVYLQTQREEGAAFLSAAKAAQHFGLSEIQVRKDFSAISPTPGKPKSGFAIAELIDGMETFLGFRNSKDAILVGVGSLGKALLNYGGFKPYGLNIVAAFDNNPELAGKTINGKMVLPSEKISDTCRRLNIHIGVITVPAKQAQLVCDQLVAGGVKALWNFAPAHLSVPEGVLVQNENMAASLAILSRHLESALTPSGGMKT